jgi:hypothetical protein
MKSDRDEMQNILNQRIVPELRKLQFKGTFPHYRRVGVDRINLLTFQFDKYGGGFIIEIANCKLGEYTTSWAKIIKPNKLTVFDLNKRKRIYSDMGSGDTSMDNWYRYDRTSLKEIINIYESVSDEVLANLVYITQYWLNGELN